MKIITWTILFILLLSTHAPARLGESIEECRLRYGRSIDGPVEREAGIRRGNYEYHNYNVAIVFSDYKAVEIHYTMRDGGPISIFRMEDLLSENPTIKGEGYTIMDANTWYITSMDLENNLVIFSHKKELATGYYDIEEKELVLTLPGYEIKEESY